MLEIVKDMYTVIKYEKRKVLVHCHAGYGRTGIVLACYMLYDSMKTLDQVVKEIREKRKSCIEKYSQMEYCRKFKDCIIILIYRYR
jgi:protein tyrosine phosphatase domain-containing protein 1